MSEEDKKKDSGEHGGTITKGTDVPQMASTPHSTIPRFSIFPNGTSHMVWSERNCDRCIKRFDPDKHTQGRSECDVENAISIASASDGTLLHGGTTPINKADAIAKRLNWDGISHLENDCPEFVP